MALLQKPVWGCGEEHRNTWYLQAKKLHILSCILLHLHSQPTQSIMFFSYFVSCPQLRENSRKQSLFLTQGKHGRCAVHLSDYNYPCPHDASTVTMLYFPVGRQRLWQPPALLDSFLLPGIRWISLLS